MLTTTEVSTWIHEKLLVRNGLSRALFATEAPRLAHISEQMATCFADGGRILTFGKGAYTTDAQHVSVEFVHPVIVGKKALPALDISVAFDAWLKTMLRPSDMVIGFAPPEGDAEVAAALAYAKERDALTVALTGIDADYALTEAHAHPLIHQELIEILYHTLWETVHVFLEHQSLGHDVGSSSFLYPFLGESQAPPDILSDVASSIISKARDDEALREQVAASYADAVAEAIDAINARLAKGGKLITLGNGGSATDANDFMLDCVLPPAGMTPVPAVSLALESANLSAISNDVGTEVVFLRQLISQVSRADIHDVVMAFSTSGNSTNIVTALQEAKTRGLFTVALLGNDGGQIVTDALADVAIVVPSDYIPRIQEVHASVYHVLREGLEVVRA
ncbi:MAG: SIS domain-containing protein [Deinococcota bacterium]